MSLNDPIAVVGISGLFPDALDVSTLWSNTLARHDATAAAPPGRWAAPPEIMVRAEPQPDRAYSDRCCLLPEFRLDPAGLHLADEEQEEHDDEDHRQPLHERCMDAVALDCR